MKLIKIFLFTYFMASLGTLSAEFMICDNWNINKNGGTINEICDWWYLTGTIDWLNSFSWTYQELEIWSFWNNFTKTEIETHWLNYNYSVGFIGNNFKTKEFVKDYNINPVWFLGSYIWVDLIYPEKEILRYWKLEVIEKSKKSSSKSWNIIRCETPEKVIWIDISIKKDNDSDYLNISWDEHKDSIKLVQVLPKQKTFYIESWSDFNEFSLKDNRKYYYYVVAYNDCWTSLYSDIIKLKYVKSEVENPYFSFKKKDVFLDLQKVFYINKELNKIEESKKDKLLRCYSYDYCDNTDLFKDFDKQIEKLINKEEYKEFKINENIIVKTWDDYITIIYKVFGKSWFYSWGYEIKEYDKFISILVRAILYSENMGVEEIKYLSYKRMQISLMDTDLDKKIENLIIHLKEINIIYDKLEDKSRLFNILKDYLDK